MDINNGLVVSDFFNELNTTNQHATLNRITLPGWHDYYLAILTESQRYGLIGTIVILCSLSIFGNVATLVFNVRRKIRPFFRTCLISLACSDLLTTIFQTTTYIAQLSSPFTSVWILGDILCEFLPFITTVAILVNSLTLVGIALDRFMAIVKIIRGTWEPRTVHCLAWFVFVWGISAGISSPALSSYFIREFFIIETDPANHTIEIDVTLAELCTSDKLPNQYFYTIIFVVIFLPLLLAFLFLNAIIAKEIFYRRRPIVQKQQQQEAQTTNTTNVQASITTKHLNATGANDNNKIKQIINNNNNTTNNYESGDKGTIDTNTISNDLNGKVCDETAQKAAIKPPQQQKGISEYSTGTTSNQQTADHQNDKKLKTSREIRQLRMFKAIVILMSAFFLCRLPTWIYLLYKLFNVTNSNVHWMLHYSFGILSLFNCVLNPFLYTFLTETIQYSSAFVQRIKAIFCLNSCSRLMSTSLCCINWRGWPRKEGVFIVHKSTSFDDKNTVKIYFNSDHHQNKLKLASPD